MFTTTMQRSLRALAVSILTVATAGLPLAASAVSPSFSDLVIFGDSLSDTGNLSLSSGGFYPKEGTTQPYFGGRYSNGPLWTELLAAGLGQASDAAPYLAGGNNYAFAGARTGTANTPPGLLLQTSVLWGSTHAAADPNALYVLVGGGNDIRDARSTFSTLDVVGNAGRQISAEAAAARLQSSLGFLASRGAEHVLVSNLPDLGFSPEAAFLGLSAASSDASARFNAQIPGLLAYGNSLGLTMHFLDMNGVLQAVRNDTVNNGAAVYGVTNLTHPCAGFLGSAGNACNVSLFSDGLHPSARAHEIIADAAFQAIGVTPVPEPQTVAMLCAGLLLIGSVVRRRQAPRA